MSLDLLGDGGTVEPAGSRTDPRVGLMFGDDGRRRGRFGDLMPGRLGVARAWFDGRGGLTTGASRGDVSLDPIDTPGRQTLAMVSAMPGLSTRFSPGGSFARELGSIQRIG